MSALPQRGSMVTRIVESMVVGEVTNARELGERLGLSRSAVWQALAQRAEHVRDVKKMPTRGDFMRVATPPPRPRAKPGEGGSGVAFHVASGQVAALRTAPVFRPLQQAAAAGPLRPGAENYRAVASLYGDQRIAYQGARPISTTATGAGASSGVK